MSFAATEPFEPESGKPLFTYSNSAGTNLQRWTIRAFEVLFGARHFERLYVDWKGNGGHIEGSIFAEALRLFCVSTDLTEGSIDAIPRTGGLLVIANHPFGVADGLAVGDLISRVRPDVKLMVNSVLCRPPEGQESLLPIDFGKSADARRLSARSRKLAVDWLDQGHVLIIFPGGGIATAPTPLSSDAADFAWHPFVARLAVRKGVQVLPVFVHGQNSRLFQIVSHYSYSLRLAMVFRETRRLRGKSVRLDVGQPIQVLPQEANELTAQLRAATFGLYGPNSLGAQNEFVFPKRIRL